MTSRRVRGAPNRSQRRLHPRNILCESTDNDETLVIFRSIQSLVEVDAAFDLVVTHTGVVRDAGGYSRQGYRLTGIISG